MSQRLRKGDEILAAWHDDGFLYAGIVVSEAEGQVHVAYFDGDEAQVAEADVKNAALGPGVAVQANWKGQGEYHRGAIVRRVGQAFEVRYDDGDQAWCTIAQIRVRTEVVAALPPATRVCAWCGSRMADEADRCGACGAPRGEA